MLFKWLKVKIIYLFKRYRKFIHFKVFPLFSSCNYKFIWYIKEKLINNNENPSLDPYYNKGLDLDKLSELYFEDQILKEATGEEDISSEKMVKYEIIKKLDKLSLQDRVTSVEKEEEKHGGVKYAKFTLKWKAYPIQYSIGVIITIIFFHLGQDVANMISNIIFG